MLSSNSNSDVSIAGDVKTKLGVLSRQLQAPFKVIRRPRLSGRAVLCEEVLALGKATRGFHLKLVHRRTDIG